MRKRRGQGRVKIDKGMYDGYLYYKKMIIENNLSSKYNINRTSYGRIIWEIHKYVMNHVLREAGTFKMPVGMPAIRVKKYKRNVRFKPNGTIDGKSLSPNWKATMELWEKNPIAKEKKKLVYFINDHTNGYSGMIWMDKSRAIIPNISPYQFRPCRKKNRELSAILLDPYNKIDYYS